jgi:cytoskeleton protein RodZ
MNSMPSDPNQQGSSKTDTFGARLPSGEASFTEPHGASFGTRLHAAREARGWDLEACAHALKLPARVLRQLERDQYDGIDSKIYLGSYIGKYGRYLGINDATIQVEVDRIRQIEPPLVATGGVSHSRFLLDRYATAATYVVLTAVIVVPMIWLGVRGTLDRDLSHLAPLDAAPVAQMDAPAAKDAVGHASGSALSTPATPPKVLLPQVQDQEQPLMASMAAFPSMESGNLAPAKPAAADAGSGGHSLTLDLNAASWVEVTGADGARLEYGLLPAGSSKTYRSDQPLEVRIGNAGAAQISIDGQAMSLDDFRRANVAHFRLQVRDGKASAASL